MENTTRRPLRALRSFTLDGRRPADPTTTLVPLHSLILPSPPPPPRDLLPPSPVVCHHLVANALGHSTLSEVPYRPSPPDRNLGARSSSSADADSDAVFFSCNLCLLIATDPVITTCGHLFCWPCLFYAIRFGGGCCSGPCVACGSEVDIGVGGNVVPIYGRGGESGGRGAPERPRARRVVAETGARKGPRVESRVLPGREVAETVRRRIGAAMEEAERFDGEDEAAAGEGREVDGVGELVQVRSRRRRLV